MPELDRQEFFERARDARVVATASDDDIMALYQEEIGDPLEAAEGVRRVLLEGISVQLSGKRRRPVTSYWLVPVTAVALIAAIAFVPYVLTRLKSSPNDFAAHFNLGSAYAEKGDIEQARRQFELAMKLRPDYMPARLALADLELRHGDPDTALKSAQDTLKMNSNDGVSTLREAADLLHKGQYDESRAKLEKILQSNPDQADTLLELGVLNLVENRYEEAGEAFRRAYELDPNNLRGLLGMTEAYFKLEQPAKAVQAIADEVKKRPERLDLKKELANAEFRAGNYDQALADFRSLIDRFADSPVELAELYARIGVTYGTTGDPQQAVENLQKARQLAPKHFGYVSQLAQEFEAMGRQSEAIAAYREALKLDPDNGVVLNNLAYLLAVTGGDLDEALTMALRAEQQLPNFKEVSDTIGWIYIKKKQGDRAVERFKDLTEKFKGNSTFHYHYALALEQKGDDADALRELKAALQSKPGEREEMEINALIQEISGR